MRVRLAAQAARLFQQMRALPVRNVAPPDAFPARGGLYHVLDYIYIDVWLHNMMCVCNNNNNNNIKYIYCLSHFIAT